MAIKSLTAEQLYDCLIEAMRRREASERATAAIRLAFAASTRRGKRS